MELTFGEKLLIARKQLDLYQYQMAEKLGVQSTVVAPGQRKLQPHPYHIWTLPRRSSPSPIFISSTPPPSRESAVKFLRLPLCRAASRRLCVETPFLSVPSTPSLSTVSSAIVPTSLHHSTTPFPRDSRVSV